MLKEDLRVLYRRKRAQDTKAPKKCMISVPRVAQHGARSQEKAAQELRLLSAPGTCATKRTSAQTSVPSAVRIKKKKQIGHNTEIHE